MLENIITRSARVGAINAYKAPEGLPEPGNGKAAARKKHTIQHPSFLGAVLGAVAGALIAAAAFAVAAAVVGAIAAATVGSGGTLGVVIAVGAAKLAAGVGLTILLGGVIQKANDTVAGFVDSFMGTDGEIGTGASKVHFNGKPAARAAVKIKAPDSPSASTPDNSELAEGVGEFFDPVVGDTVNCDKHNKPPKIAEGSDSVFINGQPAARKGDKTACGAAIHEGEDNIFIGASTVQYLAVAENFSWWQKAILIAVEFLVPPGRGLLKGIGKLFTKAGRAAFVKGARMGATVAARNASKLLSRKAWKAATQAIKKGTDNFVNAARKNIDDIIKKFGDPVDAVSGKVFEQRVDFALGQTLPLAMVRTWSPTARRSGICGTKWHDSFSECIYVNENGDCIEITTCEGDSLYFSLPEGYSRSVNPDYPEFRLIKHETCFELYHRDTHISKWFSCREKNTSVYPVLWHSDRNGNRIDFIYSHTSQLVKIQHSDGIVLKLEWHPSGWLSHILRVDEGLDDLLVSYRQDEAGYLREADARQEYHLFYDYNAEGLLSRWSDNDKTWAIYLYDDHQRCIRSECAGDYYNISLNYLPGCTEVTNSKGAVTRCYYDEHQRVTCRELPDGACIRLEYNVYGQITCFTSAQGRQTHINYLSDTGLVSDFIDAGGHQWRYTWDDDEQLRMITDPLERNWLIEYDEQGNTQRVITPDGGYRQITRNHLGLMILEENEQGARRHYSYDLKNRLISLFDEENRALHIRYDRRDSIISLSQSSAGSLRFDYDNHDRISGRYNLTGGVEKYQYDRHSNLRVYTDARGMEWHVEYGPFDLPLARVDAEGHRWEYRYDKDTLQLEAVINPAGECYQYEFNACGQIIVEKDYSGTTWHYRYDEDGNCIEKRDALGQVTRYLWDACQRLVEKRNAEETLRYRYDAVGRLLSVESSISGQISYTWDECDRITREVCNGREIRREYPDAYTVVRHIQPVEHEPGGEVLTTRFHSDRGGALCKVELPDEQCLVLERDGAGNEIARRGGNGFLLTQQYNPGGLLSRQRAGRNTRIFSAQEVSDLPQPVLAGIDREYVYDVAENLIAANDREEQLRYVLNGNGQVVTVSDPYREQERYAYDSCGYLAQRHIHGTEKVSHSDIYQWGHRLKRLNNNWYEYDVAGRLTARRVEREGYRAEFTRYRWNSSNQLTGLINAKGECWQYTYDCFGRRTEKRCEVRGIRIQYLWDGDTVAEQREYRDGVLQSVQHQVFSGWELLTSQERRSDSGWEYETRYAVVAPTGQALALFNSEGKRVWRQGKTSLWGVPVSRSHDGVADPYLGFAGQQRDEESGLYYNRFRYYDAESGCYLVQDPLGLAGGENTYGYVPNPLSWVDPFGLAGCSTTLGRNMMEAMGLPRSTKWTGYQAHHIIPKELANHPALKKIKYYIDDAGNGIFLRRIDDGVSAMARHQGNHHGYTDAIKNALDKIDLRQSTDAISKQVSEIQNTATKGMMNGVPIRSKDMWNADIFGKDIGQIGRQRVFDLWTDILR